MVLICIVAASLAALQGCSATSGTVGASGGPTGITSNHPTSPNPTAQNNATATDTATDTAPSTSQQSSTSTPNPNPPNPIGSSPVSNGKWQPTGQLLNAEKIDESVGPDHKLTATWPKGAPADKALTIKLLAKRNGDSLLIDFHAANYSGQKVSLLTGMFGGAAAVDEAGASLDFDEMNKDWTLTQPGNSPYLEAGQPMDGTMVIAAPKTGNTFNLYWTQAVNIGGIILIRDIPIVG